MHAVEIISLLDVEEVEDADKEEKSSIAHWDHDERYATNISHLTVKLEVTLSAKGLMTPLDDPK